MNNIIYAISSVINIPEGLAIVLIVLMIPIILYLLPKVLKEIKKQKKP